MRILVLKVIRLFTDVQPIESIYTSPEAHERRPAVSAWRILLCLCVWLETDSQMLCCKHSGIISPAKWFRIRVILCAVSKYGDGGKLCEAKTEKNKSGCLASRMPNIPLNRSSLYREPLETVY